IQRLALNDLPGVVATIVPFQLETYRDGFENGPENGHGGGHTNGHTNGHRHDPTDALLEDDEATVAAVYEADSVTRTVASFPDSGNTFRRGYVAPTTGPANTSVDSSPTGPAEAAAGAAEAAAGAAETDAGATVLSQQTQPPTPGKEA
ncbi:MAG: hypothetical protein ACRC1H_13420, partial [Caldilineaceae bacterium]